MHGRHRRGKVLGGGIGLMIAALALSLAVRQSQAQDKTHPSIPVIETKLPPIAGAEPMTLFLSYGAAIQTPKVSPLKYGNPPASGTFDFLTAGYGHPAADAKGYNLRFRVYSQDLNTNLTLGISVARELLRIWELNATWLHIDHSSLYHSQIVDVYLAKGGTPGGQQLFGLDQEDGVQFKSDMIYIYNLPSFTDPLEEAREVAHEYGHAVLPAVGGYSKPEYWANGYLGEKLFLRWLDQEMREGKVTTEDTMGATQQSLDGWVASNINEIESLSAQRGPKNPYLPQTDAHAMSAFHGLVLYCDSIMPKAMFGRSLAILGGEKATDYLGSAVLASEESSWAPQFPNYLIGKKVWLPIGPKGKVTGTSVLAKSQDWVKVVAKSGLKVVQPTISN